MRNVIRAETAATMQRQCSRHAYASVENLPRRVQNCFRIGFIMRQLTIGLGSCKGNFRQGVQLTFQKCRHFSSLDQFTFLQIGPFFLPKLFRGFLHAGKNLFY